MEIKVLNYEIKEVGKHIKSTKKKYSWKLDIENKIFQIDLYHSKLTLKYEIKINGIRKLKKQTSKPFDYYFYILKKKIRIKKRKEGFELFINNQTFENICLGNPVEDNSSIKSSKKIIPVNIFYDRNKKFKTKRLNSLNNNKNSSNIINKNFNKRFTDEKMLKKNYNYFSPFLNKKKIQINTTIPDFAPTHNVGKINNNKLFINFQTNNIPDFLISKITNKIEIDLNSSEFLGELNFLPTSD